MKTLPAIPTNREEFDKWLEWHADRNNKYDWDFNVRFEINGHTVSTNSNQYGHIVLDRGLFDIRDYFCTYVENNVEYKPTDYVKMKIFG